MPTWSSRSCELMAFAEICSEAELRDLLGLPSGRAVTKERTRLHAVDREWLAVSPFCVLATSDADGNCDASPKGDPAGHLVHVLDDTTVAIAERPGNKRADGYLNVLANPHVGIISLIPGRNETLRINGRARLVRDAPFFDELAVRGRRPRWQRSARPGGCRWSWAATARSRWGRWTGSARAGWCTSTATRTSPPPSAAPPRWPTPWA